MDFCTGVLLSLIICIISFWLLWRKRRFSLLERYGIPGPKPNFWTGNLNEFFENREECVRQWVKKYGKFVGFYLGAKPMIVCTDIEFLKLMQIKEFKNFTNKDMMLPDAGVPHKMVMKSLELLSDDEWKNMRGFLSSSFSTGKIKKMSPIITEAVNIFLEKVKQKKEESFDIQLCLKRLTFDMICKAAFGVSTNVQNNETDKFTQSVYDSLGTDSSEFLPTISICFPEIEPIPTKLRSAIDAFKYALNRSSIRYIIQTCKDIIESRKKVERKPEDLLQSLIDGSLVETDVNKEKQFRITEELLVANAMVFMIAGYDTTSNTLGYCLYLLSTNPDVQDKVRAEINDNVKIEEEIQYTDLSNFQYLDQVISETLRLYPLTFNVINRICAEDFKYKDRTIPKGAIVAVPVWTLHRDPAYWTDPDKFIPERFSPENRSKVDQTVYQPFGNGPRICIGMRLATAIIKFTLANLIRSYKLESALEGKELELDYTIFFIRPKYDIPVRAIPL